MSCRVSADRGWPRFGLILCIMGLAGCARESRGVREFDSQRDAEIAALVAEGSAASLATASLMSRLDTPASRSADLIARAASLAPNRPELIWVQWRECATSHCADEEQIGAHLKTLDPDNGLAWLPDLQEAWARQSPSEVTAVAAQIGAARHMKIYWNSLIVMMVDAFAGNGRSPRHSAIGRDVSTRMIYSIGILAAVSIPPLQPFGRVCGVDQLDQPGRRAACEAMFARLKDSDTVLTQGLGLRLQEKWWPVASPERKALQAERRQLDYLMMASSRVRPLHMNRDAATRLAAARRSQSETNVMEAMLTAFQEPLERPTDWKDPYSRYDR
jgi:hypothetical protein